MTAYLGLKIIDLRGRRGSSPIRKALENGSYTGPIHRGITKLKGLLRSKVIDHDLGFNSSVIFMVFKRLYIYMTEW